METHNRAKTTWPKVRQCRRAFAKAGLNGHHFNRATWAKRLGVSDRSVYRICMEETWREPSPKKSKKKGKKVS